MKVTIDINGVKTEITLTPEQIKEVNNQKPIEQRVKTYQDILDILGDEAYTTKDSDKCTIAFTKLRNIVKVFNQGWLPNWNNSNEKKWYAWFWVDGVFQLSDVLYSYSTSIVCGRLVFKNKELTQLSADLFLDIYEDYYKG